MRKMSRVRARVLALAVLVILLWALFAMAQSDIVIYPGVDDGPPSLGLSHFLEVHFINDGPSDSILLRCDSQTMLIDSGLPENSWRVAEYLRTIDVNHLDYAMVTHPHIDHIGGFVNLLDALPVDVMLWPPLFDGYKSAMQVRLFNVIHRRAIAIRLLENDSVIWLGGTKLTFMQWQNRKASINNRSVIAKVEYGDRTMLLTADLESEGQKAMLAEYGSFLQADILKMPHHGLTGYTKDANAIIAPRLGISSNGKGASDTFRAYQKYGVKYLITPNGTIIAITDGTTWYVWQLPNKKSLYNAVFASHI